MEKIIELIIDEENEISGIEAISVVENPAIEEDFIALKEHTDVKLAEVDAEQRILMGPALIPNKKIFRKGAGDDDNDYYIYFSEDTVRRASELFFIKSKHKNSTYEHAFELTDMSVVESWLIEDPKKDKAAAYGFDLPKGTWMVSMKVLNDKVWKAVKDGEVKGFSIEGYFADGLERPKESIEEKINELNAEYELREVLAALTEEVELESYGDYPESAKNNAIRGIKYNKAVNNKCATAVGKTRARQLERGENFTVPTLKRIYSYLSRAETYYKEGDNEACGTISYLLWGGKSMFNWVESKLKGLDELSVELYSEKVNDDYAIIMDRLAYASKEQAEKIASDIGCEGIHEHDFENQTWYMPCKQHTLAEVGPRGGIRRSPKAPASDTPNRNPKGKGTARGTAKGKRGAKVSAKDRKALQKKADDFNKRYKEKLGYGVTVGMLASVFQRGLGAFNRSSSPRVNSPSQWAFARVNAFLYLVKNGRPQNAKYTTDYDILPSKHPKSSK
jgi:hypothetical protein|tara:strand:- start:5971 stop:7485 length:1515 start_codon:yes stop_codon:yes gene_type:complete